MNTCVHIHFYLKLYIYTYMHIQDDVETQRSSTVGGILQQLSAASAEMCSESDAAGNHALQCVVACCSVLQCVAACSRVIQCVAVCCSVCSW